MFTGIIQTQQKPKHIKKEKNGMELVFAIPKGFSLAAGDSIAIDGICSTVKSLTDTTFTVYYMPETLRKTHVHSVSDDHAFNLEQPLTLNTMLGGHLVNGHVDTTGTVTRVEKDGEALNLTIRIPETYTRYIIYKGSICVNGTSLTVTHVTTNTFAVSLIPYTQTHTNLGVLQKGDIVNIEVDFLAKYLEKLVR